VNNHEDKDASFFIKLDRADSTQNPFRNRNYVVFVAEGCFCAAMSSWPPQL
jgi:hypothetical protein